MFTLLGANTHTDLGPSSGHGVVHDVEGQVVSCHLEVLRDNHHFAIVTIDSTNNLQGHLGA